MAEQWEAVHLEKFFQHEGSALTNTLRLVAPVPMFVSSGFQDCVFPPLVPFLLRCLSFFPGIFALGWRTSNDRQLA